MIINNSITSMRKRIKINNDEKSKQNNVTIHCNPSLAYIAVRDLQRSQRNASVQSIQYLMNTLYKVKKT